MGIILSLYSALKRSEKHRNCGNHRALKRSGKHKNYENHGNYICSSELQPEATECQSAADCKSNQVNFKL